MFRRRNALFQLMLSSFRTNWPQVKLFISCIERIVFVEHTEHQLNAPDEQTPECSKTKWSGDYEYGFGRVHSSQIFYWKMRNMLCDGRERLSVYCWSNNILLSVRYDSVDNLAHLYWFAFWRFECKRSNVIVGRWYTLVWAICVCINVCACVCVYGRLYTIWHMALYWLSVSN